MSAPEWWLGLAAMETAGPAGAEDHGLSWRDGRLHLLAHPDPDADRALAALGGDVCPCLDLLDAWTEHHSTGSILVVATRDPDEPLPAPAAAIEAIAADLTRWRNALASIRADARAAQDGDVLDRLAALRSPEEAAAQRRLGGLLLLALDARLQHRLQSSVAAALATRPNDEPALAAATAARAIGPLRKIGWSGGLADIELGDTPDLTPDHAVLPPSWVAAVWGRRLTTTPDGAFVLDVTSVTPTGAITVIAAAPGKPRVDIRVDQWENA